MERTKCPKWGTQRFTTRITLIINPYFTFMEQQFTIHAADIPAHFVHCLATDCKAAATCLHLLAAEAEGEEKKSFPCFNPKCVSPTAGCNCPHYSEARYVRCARGLKKLISQLSVSAYSAFRNEMCIRFGRSAFYRYRNGTLPLTGESLDFVCQCFLRHGAQEPLVFDEESETVDFQADAVSK